MTTSSGYPLVLGVDNVERLRITAGGNVGIGTTAPLARLHLAGGSTETLMVEGSRPGNSANFANVEFRNTQGTAYTGARIGALNDGQNQHGALLFYTNAGGGSVPTERLRIASNGNVGIGTDAPTARLDVKLTTDQHIGFVTHQGVIPALGAWNDGFTSYRDILIAPAGIVGIGATSPVDKLDVRGGGAVFGAGNATYGISLREYTVPQSGAESVRSVLHFDTSNRLVLGTIQNHAVLESYQLALNTDGAPRLTVTHGGNVGIATTDPQNRLHVNGGIRADGAIHTTGQQDITANGDLRSDRDLIVANNATINQDLTAHSSIRAGSPSRKIADGNGCYYA
jgi:hypothetical protein